MAGVFVGVATVAYLMLNKMDPFLGLNAGFFALSVNFATATIVSVLTSARPNPFNEKEE